MAAGWAVAFDAPYTWTKQVASDFGGTKTGMIIHYPDGVEGKNEIRTQFTHAIDIAPTILEVAGLPEPKVVNGIPQTPIEGTSMAYSFNKESIIMTKDNLRRKSVFGSIGFLLISIDNG